ncbi:RNase H domain-containing protein [Trichonephila clavipes]|nr:RNase H domain-containing protein [Trichonephila clavipes]
MHHILEGQLKLIKAQSRSPYSTERRSGFPEKQDSNTQLKSNIDILHDLRHQHEEALTYSELHSTYINNKQSTVPPAYHWYEAKRPGGSLFLQCNRQEKTILTHFRSGHLQALTFRDGNKSFSNLCVFCLPGISRTHS